MIKMDRIKLDRMSVGERCLRTMYAGKDIAAKSDAREIILVARKLTIQVRITRTNTRLIPGITQADPSKTPKVVATPLPPLKFRNIVQLWPAIHPNPMMIRSSAGSKRWGDFVSARSPKRITVTRPLRMSRIKTIMPVFLPSRREAFVAPTFPDPNVRISMPFKHLPKIYAVGIDPIR
jgi:hypothetical protein